MHPLLLLSYACCFPIPRLTIPLPPQIPLLVVVRLLLSSPPALPSLPPLLPVPYFALAPPGEIWQYMSVFIGGIAPSGEDAHCFAKSAKGEKR